MNILFSRSKALVQTHHALNRRFLVTKSAANNKNARNKGKPRLMGKKLKSWKKQVDRFRYHRRKVPRQLAEDYHVTSQDPTVTLSKTPEGPPKRVIDRVEVTSIEFIQNVKSLTYLAMGKLGCYNLSVARVNKSSKAALERLIAYSDEIRSSQKNLHLYQIIIVENVLRYSRDLQSRHTLWIPDDFTFGELKEFLDKQCVDDPSLHPIKDLKEYFNPFVHPTVGNPAGRILSSNKSRGRKMLPIELIRIQEGEGSRDNKNVSYDKPIYNTDKTNQITAESQQQYREKYGGASV